MQNRTAHVDHSVARHGGRRGVVDVVYLEYDLARGRHRDAIAVRQRQSLVVVQHRVEIFDPDCVDWAVQNQPDVLPLQTAKPAPFYAVKILSVDLF